MEARVLEMQEEYDSKRAKLGLPSAARLQVADAVGVTCSLEENESVKEAWPDRNDDKEVLQQMESTGAANRLQVPPLLTITLTPTLTGPRHRP